MVSVIIPAFNEELNIPLVYRRLMAVVDKIKNQTFEFVFIDDCSNDQTPELLRQLNASDKRVKTIRFARNCGSHAALRAGLEYVKSDCVITLAADLQDPPEIIPTLLEEWKKGAKIVWGARQKREGESAATKFFSRKYYQLMNWMTAVKMPPSGADIFLADRSVVDAFRQMSEKHTSVFMALAWLGFNQSVIYYVKVARQFGFSKWTIRRKIKLTIDSLLSFSDVFIRYMSILGFLTAFLGFSYAGYVFYWYTTGKPVEGWSSIMIAILVIGGIQMIMLGLLGEYLWRTYDESRKRPAYIIEYTIQ